MSPEKSDSACPEPVRAWLSEAVQSGASDLHLVVGHPPVVRLHGTLQELAHAPLEGDSLRRFLTPLCPEPIFQRFLSEKNADFSLELQLDGRQQRFRVNYFVSGQQPGACFRVIPSEIPTFEWAGFPPSLADRLAHYRNGLVLICGVAGSGKTTSLAMIINLLNQEGGYRIITVEEPVEYLFPKTPHSVVNQREVGTDVHSFADGLKYGLRQDPDVILVGEIRDRKTAQMALSAAETGHLVFSTMHTRDAKGAISRYADLFPQTTQHDVRSQLSLSLRAVVSQHLLPGIRKAEKRALALEVMFNNSAIASAIRFSKIEGIDNSILTGRSEGMITLDESVRRLLEDGKITRETAQRYMSDSSRTRLTRTKIRP
jgi:twitching motility protein PilT